MKSILVIDDDFSVSSQIGNFIKNKKRFRLLNALSGKEGIEKYKQNNPDIVFLDLLLSDSDGYEIFNSIKHINKNAVIYFITGGDGEYVKTLVNEIGANGIIVKPLDLNEIQKVLDKY